jgi:hypothetical protein
VDGRISFSFRKRGIIKIKALDDNVTVKDEKGNGNEDIQRKIIGVSCN